MGQIYKMTLPLGLLLTLFLAIKLRKNPKHLCILVLTTPLVIISFPVIIFITKVMQLLIIFELIQPVFSLWHKLNFRLSKNEIFFFLHSLKLFPFARLLPQFTLELNTKEWLRCWHIWNSSLRPVSRHCYNFISWIFIPLVSGLPQLTK